MSGLESRDPMQQAGAVHFYFPTSNSTDGLQMGEGMKPGTGAQSPESRVQSTGEESSRQNWPNTDQSSGGLRSKPCAPGPLAPTT